MKDTSDDIKKMQLQLWLTKTPAERLYQMLIDNEALFKFWDNVKPVIKSNTVNNK